MPQGSDWHKQGTCPDDNDLQKYIIKMPFKDATLARSKDVSCQLSPDRARDKIGTCCDFRVEP